MPLVISEVVLWTSFKEVLHVRCSFVNFVMLSRLISSLNIQDSSGVFLTVLSDLEKMTMIMTRIIIWSNFHNTIWLESIKGEFDWTLLPSQRFKSINLDSMLEMMTGSTYYLTAIIIYNNGNLLRMVGSYW